MHRRTLTTRDQSNILLRKTRLMPLLRIQRLTSPVLVMLIAWVVSTHVSTPQAAQEPLRKKTDLSKLGPKVGERVPGFSLKDQTGTTRTLESIMGPKGAMLVFYRSADW